MGIMSTFLYGLDAAKKPNEQSLTGVLNDTAKSTLNVAPESYTPFEYKNDYLLQDPESSNLYEKSPTSTKSILGQVDNFDVLGNLAASGEALKNSDIQNLTNQYNWRGFDNSGEKYADPYFAQQFYNLKQSNPDQYYNQLATDIGNQISANNLMNKGEHNAALNKQLNEIKDINPSAYYTAQLNILSQDIGWQMGQNRSDRNAPTIQKIQELIPEAVNSGLNLDQINSIINTNVNYGNSQNQQRIANEAAAGGSGFAGMNLGEFLRGVAPVAALAIGGPLLDGALSAGTAASSGGINFGATGGSSGLLNAGAGGAFSPAGAMATQSAAGLGGAGTGIISGLTPSSVGLAGTAGAGSLAGITGSQLAAGLGGANLGFGLTPEQLAAYESGGINQSGTSLSDVLKSANKARQAYNAANSLNSILGGSSGMKSRAAGGVNLDGLANALRGNQFTPLNLQQIQPKNPFFGLNKSTLSGEDIYDVSGSNLANALRKK